MNPLILWGLAVLSIAPGPAVHAQATGGAAAAPSSASPQSSPPAPDRPDARQARIDGHEKRAVSLYGQRRFDAAERLFASVLAARRATLGERHPATLEAMENYAMALDSLGRADEAERFYRQAVQLQREVMGDRDANTIIALSNIANFLYERGRPGEALPFNEDAVRLQTEVLGPAHPDTLNGLASQANILDALGRTLDARQVSERALDIQRGALGPRHPDTLTSLNNYAMILSGLGRWEEAAQLHFDEWQIARAVFGERHFNTITSLHNYASALHKLGRSAEAEPLAATAMRLSRAVLGNRDPDTLASLDRHAAILAALGRMDEALKEQQEALRLRREVLGERHPDTMESLGDYAAMLNGAGRKAEAGPLLEQALALRREVLGATHPDTLSSAVSLADYRLHGSSPESAYEPARLAVQGLRLRRAEPGSGPGAGTRPEALDTGDNAAETLFANAAWSMASAQPGTAVAMRGEAFEALQYALAAPASRAMTLSAARKIAGGLEGLVREREALNDEWAAVEKRATAELGKPQAPGDDKRAMLQARLDQLNKRMAEIDARLRRDAPGYFALIRPQPVTEQAARQLLRADEAAIILVPTDFGTQIMLLTREGLEWRRSDWTRDRIDRAVERLLWDVGAPVSVPAETSERWEGEGKGAYPFAFDAAHDLYTQLIAPVAGGLPGKTHLFVMAAGSLARLPLGILVSEIPKGDNGDPAVLRSAKWLADRYALIVMPNLVPLKLKREAAMKPDKPAAPFLGIGDPALLGVASDRGARNKGQLRSGFFANVGQIRTLARLPGTADELRSMWQAFGKPAHALFLGADATEKTVRGLPLKADVIAFATHGLLAGELQGLREPGLVLTPPTQASGDDDGYLAMSEIAALDIDAEWVILSACNTAGAGNAGNGSALSGLASAFFYAGARNLLVSQWPVRDDVAARLTVRAVEILRRDPAMGRALAFTKAMQEIRSDPRADSATDSWAHPAAWAPFVLVGDR